MPELKSTGSGPEPDHTWMTPEELAKCARAYDVEPEDFRSPIPTRNVSNGEYLPKPQTRQQKQVEERIKELADSTSKKLGISRRKFLASSGGMAAALLAMNEVYGKFFRVDPVELVEPAAAAEHGLPEDLFVVDDQLHFVRGNTNITLGAPSLRAIAQGPTSSAFGFPTNPFNPDGFPDEAHHDPYYPWNEALAAEYLADPTGYVNRLNNADAFHFLQYVKSIYLDSQVTVGLISNVTTFVDVQPGTNLPVTNVDEARRAEILTAAQTAAARNFINDIAGSRRAMAHGLLYVGRANLEYIQYQVENHRPDAWKGYNITHAAQPGRLALSTGTARNTAPLDTAPGAAMKLWRHDDEEVAYPTFELIAKYYARLKDEIPGLNCICVHKGLAHGLPDIPENGHPADLPQTLTDWPQLNFITYHSCIKDTFFDYFAWQQIVAAELDRLGFALFDQFQCRPHGIVRAGMKRPVGHVGDQQRALHAAAHGLYVNQNLVQRDRHRVAVTEHDIAQTVADQNDIDSRFIDDARGGIIVRGQANQTLAAFLAGFQRRRGDFFGTLRL